jgi:signal transduction histidine kinase
VEVPDLVKKLDLLLVDDHEENLIALEAALGGICDGIVKARSGRDALRELLTRDFVVILLDVNMPEMDGFETATLIRQRKRNESTPIILMTASSESEQQLARGYALGAVDCLFTPIEPEVLRAKVGTFVELARASEHSRTLADAGRAAAESRAALFETRLNTLCNRLEVGVFRATPDGMLLEANPALLRLLGSRTLDEARSATRAGGVPGRLLAWNGDGGSQPEEVFELAQPDGRSVHLSVSKTTSVGPDGARFVDGLATDITRRRAAEQEREELLARERSARNDAEFANRLKDDFLATVSHELRSPLNAIAGWAELLRSPETSAEDVTTGIEVITRNARLQTRLINDLLDMNRVVSGKVVLERQNLELQPILAGVVESFLPAAAAGGIALTSDFDPAVLPIQGDSGRIQQIVWNLLSNAIKFSRRGGHVTVALRRAGRHARFSVSDDGEGVRPEFLRVIFERFRQADPSSTRQHTGLGLGLAIVKQLVEMHGGHVSAHSAGIGKGARFDVILPVSVEPAPVEARAAKTTNGGHSAPHFQGSTRLEGVNVVVVDDVADARELVRLALERNAARVRTAASVVEAMAILSDETPDVIVSDIAMPEIDGYEFIARVRALGADRGALPAVAVTAYARTEDRERALAAGFDECLVKPIDPSQLVDVVATLRQRRTPGGHESG